MFKFLFYPLILKTFGFHQDFEVHGNKGEQNFLKCEDKVDFNVEPYQDNYGKIQNFAYEDGLRHPYKPTSYVEL